MPPWAKDTTIYAEEPWFDEDPTGEEQEEEEEEEPVEEVDCLLFLLISMLGINIQEYETDR